MKISLNLVVLATVAIFANACKKSENKPAETGDEPIIEQPANNMTKLGEAYIVGANAKAIIYTLKTVETGYNEFYVSLFDSTDGSRLSNGHFAVEPMMDMGSMHHSSPVENCKDSVTTNGYFKSAVVFSMPGTASQWWLNLLFQNHKNGKMGTGKFALSVAASTSAKFKSTVIAADNNSSVFITLIHPKKPIVGINDFEIVLHKKKSMMEYLAINNYTIEIEPTMPSMGHGSPNNVNPILIENGHYKGKVNFTMSGLWNIKIKLFKNDTLLSESQFFEITI